MKVTFRDNGGNISTVKEMAENLANAMLQYNLFSEYMEQACKVMFDKQYKNITNNETQYLWSGALQKWLEFQLNGGKLDSLLASEGFEIVLTITE